MSNFEIFLIVMVCAVPILALFMVLPKKIKKDKKEQKANAQPVKTYEELKKEENIQEPLEIKTEKVVQNKVEVSDITDQDFKSYLSRRKNISKPNRINLPNDFKDRTMPYSRRRVKQDSKPKNVAEEIQNLSPKLKAILLSRALDRKDF